MYWGKNTSFSPQLSFYFLSSRDSVANVASDMIPLKKKKKILIWVTLDFLSMFSSLYTIYSGWILFFMPGCINYSIEICVLCCSSFASRCSLLCIMRGFSAHQGCRGWLFELTHPFCQLQPVCPFNFDLNH